MFSSFFSQRGKALAKYRAGMAQAKKGDYEGAVADYSAALKLSKIPSDVKAMTLYNRSLAYSAMEENEKAVADIDAVLAMPDLSSAMKEQAQQRRARITKRAKP